MDFCADILLDMDLCTFALSVSGMGFGGAGLNLSAAFNVPAPKIKAKTVKAILNLSK